MELGVNYSKIQSFLVSTPWQLEVEDLYVYAVFNWVNVLKIIDEIQTGFINYFEFCYHIVYEQFGLSEENKLVNTLKSSWKIFLSPVLRYFIEDMIYVLYLEFYNSLVWMHKIKFTSL